MPRTRGKRPPIHFLHKVPGTVLDRRDIYANDAEEFVRRWLEKYEHIFIELYGPFTTVDGIITSMFFAAPWSYHRRVEIKNVRYGDVVFPYDPLKPAQLPYCIEKNVLILFLKRERRYRVRIRRASDRQHEWIWMHEYSIWWMDGSKLAQSADVSIDNIVVA